MRSVELFAGAGGLGLGCELAGFRSEVVAEWDRWACDSMRQNQSAGYPLVRGWRVIEGDVREVDWTTEVPGAIDLVSGGPPCQPFSMGGKHRAAADARDMFPAAAEVIRLLRPRAFLLENVKGLTRTAFANYFHYIQLRLTLPELLEQRGEDWGDHYHRLQAELTTAAGDERLRYNVIPTLVNAADYGVPQQRHRVFLIGFRDDVEAEWSFPSPTHSLDALLYEQWVTGEYWERHKVSSRRRPAPPERFAARLQRLADAGRPTMRAWRTVRDALTGLPEPTTSGSRKYRNHVLQEGARSYPGHNGSPLDMPAKTLKAGDHGVPGGENMLRYPDGMVRYFTVRESARLQTFPDSYELHGSWTEAMRQLGNAVPVLLAQTVAASIAEHLALANFRAAAAELAAAHRRWSAG